MEVDDLYELLRTERSVIPFVGAGLATGAGAPGSDTLAAEMAKRLGVPSGSLLAVTTAAEARHGSEPPKEVVADVVARARLSPTPELRAIAANRTGRVLTTNYDRAIERAAEAVGREPVPLSYTDARALEPPADGTVHVVHLHGQAEDPPSIVLPGAATQALIGDETFALVARSLMAQHLVLYLGFRLGPAEIHLRSTVAWLASRITGARRHVLMVRDRDRDRRGEDLQALAELPIVDVVTYADPSHAPVTQAALLLRKGSSFDGEDARPLDGAPPNPYVMPVLVPMRPDEELATLEYRLREVEQGREPFVGLEQLAEPVRTLLVAGPGLGKTELLRLFARDDSQPPAVFADLTELPGLLDEEGDPLRAVTRLLGTARAGRPEVPRPTPRALDGATLRFLLDSLDEVPALRRTDVAEAVVAAASHWEQHRWIVATRPDAEVLRLADADFRLFRILPSAAWARTYFEVSAVPPERVERATLQNPDLGTLLGIPLYAQVVAERLRAGEDPPGTAFELLSEAQRRAVEREAAKRGLDSDELSHWMRCLAVGLELTGRGDAPVYELAEVPGIGLLGPLSVRERLVRASLLADLPGRAAFPRRTVQELLCAPRRSFGLATRPVPSSRSPWPRSTANGCCATTSTSPSTWSSRRPVEQTASSSGASTSCVGRGPSRSVTRTRRATRWRSSAVGTKSVSSPSSRSGAARFAGCVRPSSG